MKTAFTILCFAMLLVSAAVAQDKKSEGCAVRGRVVDDAGAPVPKAFVLVDGGTPAGWEDLITYENADDRGNFSYKFERCPFPSRAMTLYVTSPFSYDNYVMFDPPFLRNGRAGRVYAGRSVRGKRKGDIDLGDVRMQAVFTAVTLKFVGRDGRPLLNQDDWGNVWFRLKTSRGVWASERMLSAHNIEKAVRAEESAIVMELPEGEWSVEVRPGWKGRPWLKADRLVSVPRGSAPFTLTLQMDQRNKPRGSNGP